ncbi:hypothetical protein N8D56_04850 [Devosia sp. A8/3-2]|nr:hypothetical protein N8D56_04850 [Devosia sp. A8/3-2]
MSRILVPTLSELRVELDQARAALLAADAECDRVSGTAEQEADAVYSARSNVFWELVRQISAQPAASLADLRVKAHALQQAGELTDWEMFNSPTVSEAALIRQLIVGVADERIAQ